MKTRIEKLRHRIRAATGQDPVFNASPGCPPKIEEELLKNILAYETAPKRTLFDVLEESGVELVRPGKLRGRELQAKLWEIIEGLLSQSIILCNTDHLDDHELYTLLWSETLRREFVVSSGLAIRIDMTRTGIDEGIVIYLTYYAGEDQRKLYAEFHPDIVIPEHIEPPRRRDHLIPDVGAGHSVLY